MPIIQPTIQYSSQYSAGTIKDKDTLIVFCDAKHNVSSTIAKYKIDKIIKNAIKIENFKGKFGEKLQIINPQAKSGEFKKIIVISAGELKKCTDHTWLKLGGIIANGIKAKKINILAEIANGKIEEKNIANIAIGIKLGAYRFAKHKTNIKNENTTYIIYSKNAKSVSLLWKKTYQHIADGVMFARDLTNEPANVLTPAEFVKRIKKLKALGAKIEIFDQKAMQKLKMNALLGVAQGSQNPPYMAVIKWNGAKNKKQQPLAFIGKGVTFDTGGISLKPANGMEDMRGDMGGAAAVAGLMHTLAARKAKINAIGMLGLVENMPDAKAQRPGDIVTAMSGKTIEVLNTDAEGRLVLADVLHYCQKKYQPKFMINLATLTGAILVALGNYHAGLFANDDKLADNLYKAGQTTQEKVWRLPLTKEYDKLLDSKNADVKNIGGGRYAGSITAAQFLQRFVDKKIPWAHLDIAGTAFDAPKTEINKSWGSGFGVRLLNQLTEKFYE